LHGDGHVPRDVLQELALLRAVGIEFARGEHNAAQAAVNSGERDPIAAAKLVALHVANQIGAEIGFDGKIGHIQRLLGSPGDFGGRPFERKIAADERSFEESASDGFDPGAAGLFVDEDQHKVVEANQFRERIPQAAEQRIAIAAADKSLGDFGERAVFEGRCQRRAWAGATLPF